MSIRVLIADDHAIVAEGVSYVVTAQPDMEVVACVPNGLEAVRRTIELRPHVALIDHAMPLLNGVEATREICRRNPETRVVMLSMYSNQIHVLRALQAGAVGYVAKRAAAKEVVEAIRAVHQGRRYLTRDLLDFVIDQISSNAVVGDPLRALSGRERQVLQMLAEGYANGEIAERLALSPKTVETYRSRLMQKLRIHDFATLIKFAIQHGITSLD
jgi:two-component system, NarL family, response regulator NreC